MKNYIDKFDFEQVSLHCFHFPRLRLTQDHLSGVDFDWEYPNQTGAGSNQRNSNDTANLLRFLKIMRSLVGPSKILAAAVSPTGFVGPDDIIADASPFARYLDYIVRRKTFSPRIRTNLMAV